MGRTNNFQRLACVGLTASCLWLTACNTPPNAAGSASANPATAPDPAAEAKAKAEQANKELQKAELRKDLGTVGVEVSETPEGRIKLSIPSDSSFGLGSAAIKSSSAKLLDALADVLNKYPKTSIEVVGHTDATGSDAINLPLSAKRAESTRDYLVERQVAADRFSTQGWGSDQPIADNKTSAGRAANRRVEVFINEH